jgi:hypothetical protein
MQVQDPVDCLHLSTCGVAHVFSSTFGVYDEQNLSSVPFTDMYIRKINCTLPRFFLPSQFRHNIFVVPGN